MTAWSGGANAPGHGFHLFEGPSSGDGLLGVWRISLLNSEELLTCLRIAVFNKNFVVSNVKVLVNEMKSESIKLAMFRQCRADILHALEVILCHRGAIVQVFDVHPLHRLNYYFSHEHSPSRHPREVSRQSRGVRRNRCEIRRAPLSRRSPFGLRQLV